MYKGPGGPNMAAVMIQKTWRYYKAFSNFKNGELEDRYAEHETK